MKPFFLPNALRVSLILGSAFLPAVSAFAQGNAPKALSISNVFGPRTEVAAYIDIAGARKSGFSKKAEDEFPELMDAADEANEAMAEFTELTGIAAEDLAEVAFSFTGMNAFSVAIESGEEPNFDSNASFVVAIRLAKPVDIEKLVGIVLAKAEEEDGPETRKMIEDSRSEFRGATLFTMPKEMLEEEDIPFPMSVGVRSVGKQGFFAIGKTSDVKSFFSGGRGKKADQSPFVSQVRNALPDGSQFWLSVPLPKAALDQATAELSENPIMAGFAQVIGKMRELGLALHFKDDSMGVNIGFACEDAQSAVQIWTLSQGLLAMGKLAAAGEGSDMPPFVQKITSVAKEKSVVFSTEVTIEDLAMLAENVGGAFDPGGIESEEDNPEDLVGEDAPDFEIALLDGSDFKLSSVKGKNVVVLDFWATWCGPCVKALPEVRAATDALKDKGVILVAVNQGEPPADIQGFLKRKKWDGLAVGLDPESEVGDKFSVQGIPQTVIIDKEGVIREVHVGYGPGLEQRLLRELKEILSE